MTELRPVTATLKELRQLAQAAAVADDATLAKVVATLDRLDHRGEADLVLDQVRPRLRALSVPRRLNLTRLLFLPLDGAIRAPKEWRRGEAGVPRAALAILAEIIAARLHGPPAGLLDQMEGLTTADAAAIAQLGGVLWLEAARLLPGLPPPEWAETGLGAADYQTLHGICQPIWAAGPAVWAAVAAGASGPPEKLARAALAAVAPAGPAPLSVVLATLLTTATAPGQVAHIAALVSPQARGVAVQALDSLLQAPPPPFAGLGIERATEAALTLARRLDDLIASPLLSGDRLRQAEAARRGAEEACRERYLAGAEAEVMAPIQKLLAAAAVRDDEVLAVEAAARALRGLDAAGRRLGGAVALDRSAKELVGRLTLLGRAAPKPQGLQPADLARCIEILAGPQAAATALAALVRK